MIVVRGPSISQMVTALISSPTAEITLKTRYRVDLRTCSEQVWDQGMFAQFAMTRNNSQTPSIIKGVFSVVHQDTGIWAISYCRGVKPGLPATFLGIQQWGITFSAKVAMTASVMEFYWVLNATSEQKKALVRWATLWSTSLPNFKRHSQTRVFLYHPQAPSGWNLKDFIGLGHWRQENSFCAFLGAEDAALQPWKRMQ